MPRALVVGAYGGLGQAVVKEMVRRGWQVRGLVRSVDATRSVQLPPAWSGAPPEYIVGDAMVEEDVLDAADGVDAIVHAANPPKLREWDRYALPMLRNSIKAALAAKARLVLPAGLFNYAPNSFPDLDEDSVQQPTSVLGLVKVEMEQLVETTPGLKSLIVRSGTHLSAHIDSSVLAAVYLTPGKPIKALTTLQSPGVGHCWAYVPDLAQTIVQLLELRNLAASEKYHFRGYYDQDGSGIVNAIQQAVGNKLSVKTFPWWAVRLFSPFSTLLRNLWEVRYLWKRTSSLNNTRLKNRLGKEPCTPVSKALKTILVELGCVQTT